MGWVLSLRDVLLGVVGLRNAMTCRVVGRRSRAKLVRPHPMNRIFTAFLLVFSLFAQAAPVSLFDGKTLAGWEGDTAWWRVEGSEIRGGSLKTKVPKNFFLATEKSYQNFDLRVKLRLTGTGFVNSGVQMRSVRVPNSSEMSGYQVDYGTGWFGKLYDESRRNKVIADSIDPKAVLAAVKEGDWNEYRILAEGPRIRSWINGVLALDFTEKEANIAMDGKIGIQIHGGGAAEVQVKDVTIEELPATPGALTWDKVKPAGPKKAAVLASRPEAVGYNDVRGTHRQAEEQLKMFKLPAGFEIELFAKESADFGKFIMLIFDQKGRAWSSTAFEYPVDANENPAAADALYKSKARDKVIVFDKPFEPGLHQPRTYADGLAIPEGVLPYKDGVIVQHGHDIVNLRDTTGSGKADKREVLLTGFGVQDSHLFPHQFTRAPGGWFWLAQGAFNKGTVVTTKGDQIDFPSTRMARFRPDGSFFEPTSTGPCNIWGLVLTGEGESFIQEANDYGYPVMPFHEYAWYPGCADRLAKSYQPPFPVQAQQFRMGGTGLSGLALSDKGVWPAGYDDVMYVANPITSKINAIRMTRDGPRYALEKLDDFVSCEDPFFRPIAMTMGPDGCLYVVDWYNKIISHNEVARNHPDRDKTSGRIWRIKPKGYVPPVQVDYTQLSSADLIARLGGKIMGDVHLAWQTLSDRALESANTEALLAIIRDENAASPRRIQALWVLGWQKQTPVDLLPLLIKSNNRNVRREAVNAIRFANASAKHLELLRSLKADADPEVRSAAIKALGEASLHSTEALGAMLEFVQPSLDGPVAPDRSGKPIKVGVAYDREFERFLVRMYLEREPEAVAKFLASDVAKPLPLDGRIFAALALDLKVGAPIVAGLVPQLGRLPNDQEVLRLAQSVEDASCVAALKALLSKPASRDAVVEQLLSFRTSLDAAKSAGFLAETAKALLSGSPGERILSARLVGGFQIAALEKEIIALASEKDSSVAVPALQALQLLRAKQVDFLKPLLDSADKVIADQALATLVASRSEQAAIMAFERYAGLSVDRRRLVLNGLSSSKAGASQLIKALAAKQVPIGDVDGPAAEKLALALGDGPELKALMSQLGAVFRPVLLLDGTKDAFTESKIDLKGPFTLECWIRLAPGIDNADGIIGAAGKLSVNFFAGRVRAYVFAPVNDAVTASKPMTPDLWTHIALTRDAEGIMRIYQNGELDGTAKVATPQDLTGLNIGWTTTGKGTEGAMAEYRIWNVARSGTEIRNNFTRTFAGESRPASMTFYNAGGDASWGKLHKGARVARTTDVPPLLTAAQFAVLEKQNAHYMELGRKGGDPAKGKMVATICQTCHTINGQGGQIAPNLSGAGAMGLEAVVRNIMDPNAAMEAAFRVFRLELISGETLDSFYVTEDAKAYVIRQPGSEEIRVPKATVRSARYLRRSLMPEGLLDALNDEQVSNLLAYLMTLK